MTTFTTEDREYYVKHPYPENPWVETTPEKTPEELWKEKWGRWSDDIVRGWGEYNQTSIEYFWPLTEQIGLDLDYTDSQPQTTSYTIGTNLIGGTGPSWTTLGMNTITPQLTITPVDASGYIKIGGVNIGLEKKPNILQRVIHRLLGFDWKDK